MEGSHYMSAEADIRHKAPGEADFNRSGTDTNPASMTQASSAAKSSGGSELVCGEGQPSRGEK